MKYFFILVLVGTIAVASFAATSSKRHFADTCRQKGGVPEYIAQKYLCLRPDSVIKVG